MVIKSVQIIYQLKDMKQIEAKMRELGLKIFEMYEIQEIK